MKIHPQPVRGPAPEDQCRKSVRPGRELHPPGEGDLPQPAAQADHGGEVIDAIGHKSFQSTNCNGFTSASSCTAASFTRMITYTP